MAAMAVNRISAVTFAVSDMERAVDFYCKLGFVPVFGDKDSQFATLRAGDALINLALRSGYDGGWWGRTIFRVDSADVHYAQALNTGIHADPPRNSAWGERYFHVTDPDGHELSFAERLPGQT
jgi:catechol 2,3-dioxygenase-like lactoylglutathione lyase family enzyme